MESEKAKDNENENENEAPHEPEIQLTLLNFSFERCGFEYSLSNGLDFDNHEEFIRHDDGQNQDQPTIFDEVDLIGRLRDTKQRNSMLIPPILYEFYDKCKQHFSKEFVELLAGYISNIEIAKRLKDENSDGRLLSFFDIQLAALNFGTKHQTFIDGAKDCDEEIKSTLKECGKELQKIAQTGRERTADAARKKLQACNADFTKFGSDLWQELCLRTSLKNILDQHFAVRSIDTADTSKQDRGDEPKEFHDAALTDGSTRYVTWPMSTWLYNAAIHDSKKDVDIEIRKRRAQKIKAAAEAGQVGARQAMVDLRADAARPEDAAKILGERFRQIDQEVANLKEGMASISTSIDKSDNDHTAARTPAFATTDRQMLDASKNDITADSTDRQQQSAAKTRDSTRHRASTSATTTREPPFAATTQRNVTHVQGTRPTRPPSQDHANDNERMSQQQRTVHQHPSQPQGHGQNQRQGQNQQQGKRGRQNPRGQQDQGQPDEHARQPHDEEWHWPHRNAWRGRGRGYARGRGRDLEEEN
jgi:hypothetical protein